MITLPISDLLILPGVTFYFKKDMFPGQDITAERVGEDVLFLMLKEEKSRDELTPDDFYPLGVSGEIDSLDEEGNVRIRAKERVEISDIEIQGKEIQATASIRPQVEDVSQEEEKARFKELKGNLLKFVQGFQWGAWARGFILHWKNLSEIACALGSYLNLSWEEKYEILELDSRKAYIERIEEIIYELIEVFRVGEEAEQAQQETHESAYRESALKKQIEFLQNQLDEMHPENITDVRRFEKKIQESGMNEIGRAHV